MRWMLAAIALTIAAPSAGQISNPTTAADAQARAEAAAALQAAQAAQAAAATRATQADVAALQAAMPTPSTTMPPAVTDSGATGVGTGTFARADHTHASKARRIVGTTGADGVYVFNYAALASAPVCAAVAEVAAGVTDVINVQIVGVPTTTQATFLVNRMNRSVATLIGLTVLSVPAQPGVTKVHAICLGL